MEKNNKYGNVILKCGKYKNKKIFDTKILPHPLTHIQNKKLMHYALIYL